MSVTTWLARFLTHRLDGLVDLPRSGAPRVVTDAAIEGMVTLTLESQPENATHWSTRAMARRVGMSQSMVSRVWRAFGLQPHKTDTFKLSTDPAFVDKVRDVVGLYMAPPHRALVLCVDEKPQIQALTGTAPVLPMRPGQPERRTHDYRRQGTTDLFAALDVQVGTVIGHCTGRHRSIEFRDFLDQIEAAASGDLEAAIHAYIDQTNADPKPFVWIKPADAILASVGRVCQRTSNSYHSSGTGARGGTRTPTPLGFRF